MVFEKKVPGHGLKDWGDQIWGNGPKASGAPMLALAFLCAGFLFSRTFNNIGLLMAGLYAIGYPTRLREALRLPWMWSFFLLALVPLTSDLWLEGAAFNREYGVKKTILILLPLFVAVWRPDSRTVRIAHWIFMGTMAVSTFYSLIRFGLERSSIEQEYGAAKVMPVLAYRDHIRISWATSIACLVAFYELLHERHTGLRRILWTYMILQIAFLHILGAKTGLLSLYLMAFLGGFLYLPGRRRRLALLSLPVLAVFLYIAYLSLPTLQKRIDYMRYDFSFYSRGEFRPELSDGTRVLSIMAGIDLIRQYPLTGVGFSRLDDEMQRWYATHAPELAEQHRFLPSSQLLVYAASGGIFGLLIALFHLLWPFADRSMRANRMFWLFFAPVIASYAYEIHLEGQVRLFLYGFFAAWFWLAARDTATGPPRGYA